MNGQTRTAENPNSQRLKRFAFRAIALTVWLFRVLVFLVVFAWLIGRVFSDRYGWSQWLWWIPTPAAVAAALLGTLASLRAGRAPRVRRNRLLRWALVFFAIVLYFAAIEHRLFRSAPNVAGATGGELRIAHWNLGRGLRTPSDMVLQQILATQSDVVVITNPIYDITDQAWMDQFAPGHRTFTAINMAVISRLAIRDVRLLIAVDHIVIVQVEIDATEQLGRPIVLYLVDLPSSPKIGRCELARRVRRLLDDPANYGGTAPLQPDIVIGDFNITRGSASLAKLFPTLRHAFNEAGHGYGASFHRQFPLYHIDHILIGNQLRAIDYRLIDPQMSRHRMQVAQVAASTSNPTVASDPR